MLDNEKFITIDGQSSHVKYRLLVTKTGLCKLCLYKIVGDNTPEPITISDLKDIMISAHGVGYELRVGCPIMSKKEVENLLLSEVA